MIKYYSLFIFFIVNIYFDEIGVGFVFDFFFEFKG